MLILRVKDYNGDTTDLDMFQGESIYADYSAIEAQDLGEIYGLSTQEIDLPGNDHNNQFFGNLFNLGSTPETGFTRMLDAQLLYEGAEIFTGKLYLDSVITDQEGDTIYRVVLVNETIDFKYLASKITLADLDWSYYDHTLNFANITSSWTDGLFGGDIVYPLINYGKDYNDDSAPIIGAGGEVVEGAEAIDTEYFDCSTTPLRPIDFRPAIRTKAVVNTIFQSLKYGYSSSLFDTDDFKDTYIVSTKDEYGFNYSNPTTSSLQAKTGGGQTFVKNTDTIIDFPLETYDNGNTWSTNTYTADASGSFTFYAQVKVDKTINTAATVEHAELTFKVNGVLGPYSIFQNVSNQDSFTIALGPTQIPLNPGDVVEVNLKVNATGAFSNIDYTINNGKIEVQGAPKFTDVDVKVANIFDPQMTCLDFLKGLTSKFNLVIEPDTLQRKQFIIDSYDNWLDGARRLDWTNKVDRSVKFEISHPIQDQASNIKFTDKEDADILNEYTQENLDKIYGEYTYKSDSDVTEGSETIGEFFSPTPIGFAEGTNDMILPELALDNGGKKEPYKFNIRILYKLGLVNTSTQLRGLNVDADYSSPGHYFIDEEDPNGCVRYRIKNLDPQPLTIYFTRCLDGSSSQITIPQDTAVQILSTTIPTYSVGSPNIEYSVLSTAKKSFNQYMLFHHLNLDVVNGEVQDADFTTTNDLHFGNLFSPGHYSYHQKVVSAQTPRTAFLNYWSHYINGLYDDDARKLTCDVKFSPFEIQGLRLHDLYFIDGHYYRIDKISGFDLTKENTCQVDLIKVLPRLFDFPIRGRFNEFGRYERVVIDQINVDGTIDYVDASTGLITTSSVVNNVSHLDGIQTFGNTAVWNTIPAVNDSSATSTTITNTGNNNIAGSTNNVNVSGGGNQVKSFASKVNVVGTNNIVKEYSSNVSVSGIGNEVSTQVDNASILTSQTSKIENSSNVSVIGGISSSISSSNASISLGANIDIKGGEKNIVVGNGAVDTQITTQDMFNVVAINPTRDISHMANGGEDLHNYAYIGSYKSTGAILTDITTLRVNDGDVIYLTGSDAKDTHTYKLETLGSTPFNIPAQIHLPSTAKQAPIGRDQASGYNREFRFLVDNSLQSNDVRLYPSGSDFINGTLFHPLSANYSTTKILGTPTMWYLV